MGVLQGLAASANVSPADTRGRRRKQKGGSSVGIKMQWGLRQPSQSPQLPKPLLLGYRWLLPLRSPAR
jgi:hypothetical protein